MRKIEIKIKGPKAVDVGYSPFLLLNAMNLGIEKVFASNAIDGVVVRVDGDDADIDRYVEFVRSAFPDHAEVDGIEVVDNEGKVMEASLFLQLLQLEMIEKCTCALLRRREQEPSSP
jgi:acylphosphatase